MRIQNYLGYILNIKGNAKFNIHYTGYVALELHQTAWLTSASIVQDGEYDAISYLVTAYTNDAYRHWH